MTKIFTRLFVPLSLFAPLVASAQTATDIINIVIRVINNALVPLVLAVAFLVFIWGLYQYFIAGSEEDKKQGRSLMIWGILAFFVMLTVFGIVNVLVSTFNLVRTQLQSGDIPQVGGINRLSPNYRPTPLEQSGP